MDKAIRVLGLQIQDIIGDRNNNLKRAEEMIRTAPGHNIYVLPELSSTGYGKEVFDNLESYAEDASGPSYNFFSRVAKDVNAYICYSYPRRGRHGEYMISSSVVNPEGDLVLSYDKLHICQFGQCSEKDYFVPGKSLSQTFQVRGITVGLTICYDIRFPELFRDLTVNKQAQLILHPGGWPRDNAFFSWHTFVKTRAMENTVYLMSVNRAGENNGGSIFCSPFFNNNSGFTALGKREDILQGIIDPEYINTVRKEYTFLKDRKTDLY